MTATPLKGPEQAGAVSVAKESAKRSPSKAELPKSTDAKPVAKQGAGKAAGSGKQGSGARSKPEENQPVKGNGGHKERAVADKPGANPGGNQGAKALPKGRRTGPKPVGGQVANADQAGGPTTGPVAGVPVGELPPTNPVVSFDPKVASEAAAEVRAQRKSRARRLARRAGLGVGLPTLLGAIYFFGIASSRYQSESLFMVQSAEARQSFGLETLIGAVPGSAATRDTLAVRDFIMSREMLGFLEKEHAFRKRFQSPSIDWVSRLPADATFEETYEYYGDAVLVDHDSNSGVLTLKVRAFSPEYSKELAQSILEHSEKMVNQLSERARLDQTKLARAEVQEAEKRLTKARQEIVKLQQEHSEFNPEASASQAMSLRSQLQGELAKAQAELMQAKAFMQPNAPRVVALNARVQSLSAQVSQENRRLVNPGDKKGLNTTYAMFDAAMIEKEFAQKAYESALATLEVARTEAVRQHRYLATIASPSIADEETHPKRIRAVLTIFVLSVMLFGIGSLMVATVREHARV